MIPKLVPVMDDELFYSYIIRLTKENGFDTPQNFIGRLLCGMTSSTDISRIKIDIEGRRMYPPVLHDLEFLNTVPFILSTSLYPFQSIFLTKNRQANAVNILFNRNEVTKRNYQPLVSELFFCEECKNHDIKNYGFTYLRRAHQLPGVTMCHIHNTPLRRVADNSIVTEHPSDAIQYAKFSAQLLWSGIQADIDQLRDAVQAKLSTMATNELPFNTNIPKQFYFSTRYRTVPDMTRILMHLFGNADNLAASLTPDHGLTARFIDAIGDEYTVYKPFGHSLIEMRHNACGTKFFTTPFGFLAGRRCPSCTQETIKQTLPFTEQVAALVGDEYTVLDEYKSINSPINIRHNACGNTQTYSPKHFLDGSRCKHCTKIISVYKFPKMVQYITNGQYTATRHNGNLFEITEAGGPTIEITARRFLQEAFRPTPSDILPVPIKNIKKDWAEQLWKEKEQPSRISKKDLYARICSLYAKNALIFMESLREQFPNNSPKMLKSGVHSLIQKKMLFRVDKGIYILSDRDVPVDKIIKAKYLVYNGTRIGIPDSKTLAYEMGLSTEKPDTIYIMSNKEATKHGRKIKIKGVPVHLRGSEIVINEENYKYIMVLQAIRYCWHYSTEHDCHIPEFIKKNRLSLDIFLSILPHYSETVIRQFQRYWRKL